MVFRSVRLLVSRLGGRRGRPVSKKRPASRSWLRLEELEERVVPATDYWTGAANANWNNVGNWQTAPRTGGTKIFPPGASGFGKKRV
jgi:hypothetical protein